MNFAMQIVKDVVRNDDGEGRPQHGWNDLNNDAMAIHFVKKYFMTAAGSKTLMFYVEEKIFYLFNGVYWKSSAQELMRMFLNDGPSDQQFVVHLWSAFKVTEDTNIL